LVGLGYFGVWGMMGRGAREAEDGDA